LAAGAGLLVIATAASYELGARRPDPIATGTAPTAPTEATTPPSAPIVPASAPSVAATVTATTAPEPRAEASATTRAPADARHPRGVPPKPRPVSCTPPYTIDANGFHIPKPQCL
jgi:hypothetical protein